MKQTVSELVYPTSTCGNPGLGPLEHVNWQDDCEYNGRELCIRDL
jgi:hypothetical protein